MKVQTIPSDVDASPVTERDQDLDIYLNHGWTCHCAPSGDSESMAGKGDGWQSADLARPPCTDEPVRWFRRTFYLPEVDLPRYRWSVSAVSGTVRLFINGEAVQGDDFSALRAGRENTVALCLEGTGSFIQAPVMLTVGQRIQGDPGFGKVSQRFAAIAPAAVKPVPFLIGDRAIRMRQGVLRIPVNRKVRAVHYLCCINPENPGQQSSVFAQTFADGENERLFVMHGEAIGSPDVPRPLPSSDCHVIQANVPGCEIDSRIGVYDFVWDNTRPERPVRELVVDKYLKSQSSTKTVVAITLETARGFEPLELGDHANAPLDLPLPRGLVRLGFAPRVPKRLMADGVPYLTAADGKLVRYRGGKAEITGGFKGSRLHLLGAIADNSSHYGSIDRRINTFFGDELGQIRICYEKGAEDSFPIVLGVNCWLGHEWSSAIDINGTQKPSDCFARPFFSDDAAWEALCRTRAWRQVDPRPHRWGQIALALRPLRVRKIVFTRNPAFVTEPVFSAITVEQADGKDLLPLPQSTVRDRRDAAAPPALKPADLCGRRLSERVSPLQQSLYRSDATLPDNPVLERPEDYEGPDVEFSGKGLWATMLSNTFAYALRDTVGKLVPGPDTSATSTRLAPLYGVQGTWKLNVGRGNKANYDCFWSRDHGRTALERYEMGLKHLSPNELSSTDRAARLSASPVHHTQEPDRPYSFNDWYQRTTTGKSVFGNPENDGHGLVMLQRHTHWLHSGMSRDWLNKHWQGTEETAEWVCWQLDNPFHPDPKTVKRAGTWNQRHLGLAQPKDVLWTSSECSGYRDYEIYSNACCLAGLRAAIRMGKAAGKAKQAKRWERYANRLAKGIETHLLRESPFGPIWRYSEHSSWDAWCEAAGPLLLAPDLDSYDASQALSAKWLQISANTFNFLVDRMPDYMVPGHVGYGYGFFLQAALLLDRMSDASRILENILRVNYDGRVDPWIVGECFVLRHDRSFWYRWGDHGNSVQQGEVLKGIRLVLGVDDLDPAHIRLMPRLPDFCDGFDVKDYPVMLRKGASVVETKIDLAVKRTAKGYDFCVRFQGASPRLSVRLGPFPHGTRGRVVGDEKTAGKEWIDSGDSAWVFVNVPAGKKSRVCRWRAEGLAL